MQEESGDFDDVLCEIVENHGRKRGDPVRADPSLPCQPRTDHASETQRERQYAYARDFLKDPLLPRGGCDGIYRNGNGVAPTPGRYCSVVFYVFIRRGAGKAPPCHCEPVTNVTGVAIRFLPSPEGGGLPHEGGAAGQYSFAFLFPRGGSGKEIKVFASVCTGS